MVMNIELKPIAESKVRQLGGDVCGVLVRNEAGALAAVSDMGRVTWLDDCVTQGDCKGECVLPGQGARAQGDAEKEAEKEESKGDFPLKEESLIRKAARAQGDAEPVAYISHTSESSCLDWFAQFDAPRHTPLYTHPPKAQAVPESIEVAIDMLEDYASALGNGDLDGAGHSTTACIHEVIDQLATAPQPPLEQGHE